VDPEALVAATSNKSKADNIETWAVSEVDKKGKKKKGTLGIGNGAVFFASESDKVALFICVMKQLTILSRLPYKNGRPRFFSLLTSTSLSMSLSRSEAPHLSVSTIMQVQRILPKQLLQNSKSQRNYPYHPRKTTFQRDLAVLQLSLFISMFPPQLSLLENLQKEKKRKYCKNNVMGNRLLPYMILMLMVRTS
jgi:hypothetical protein